MMFEWWHVRTRLLTTRFLGSLLPALCKGVPVPAASGTCQLTPATSVARLPQSQRTGTKLSSLRTALIHACTVLTVMVLLPCCCCQPLLLFFIYCFFHPCSEFTKEHKGQIICGVVAGSIFSEEKVTCAVTGGTGGSMWPLQQACAGLGCC